jgi:hypothetical protein
MRKKRLEEAVAKVPENQRIHFKGLPMYRLITFSKVAEQA